MIEKRIRTIEMPTGTGEVSKEGKTIAKVKYSLRVTQEIFVKGVEEVEGLKNTYGEISVMDVDKGILFNSLDSNPFTLLMEDKRKIEFFVKRARDITSGIYLIQGSGDFF